MKILIHIPSSVITGGSEALHQLCDALSEDFETYVCYFNDSGCDIPKKFKIYNVKKSDYFDNPKTIHIIPETAIKYFYHKISKGVKVIYWLSVDNYLGVIKDIGIPGWFCDNFFPNQNRACRIFHLFSHF